MSEAAVTGATGFLGSHLTARLLERGWDVRGLARPSSDRDRAPDGVRWVVGDVTDDAVIERLVADTDAVFHLAGVGLWSATPETVTRVNVEGTRTVLEAAARAAVDRVVFTSTAGTRRAAGGVAADESDVAAPIGAYQGSKLAAEALVDDHARTHDAVTVHPTAVFGPGDGTISARLVSMATSWTTPVHPPGGLSLVGVEDVVEGLLAAHERGESGRHYILGGENLTYREAVDRIASVAGGSPAVVRVPPAAIHAAGPVAAGLRAVTGRPVFPFDGPMARLATQRQYYSSRRAIDELGYSYRPIEDCVPAVISDDRTARR